ncbi:EamA family transporter [Shewanella surugensis]|uniref:EamA family transporter n=1 Tax=Shewanella surugensis TaxID=212020 RepID=A0ABT0LBM0_9GAMM|nr:EamA family transporter [Shewanella surugensis]MCL1125069.1 EamA family transporter [Shewanella surugensis]
MNQFTAIAFALIAAIGNAFFVIGQKKAIELANPFTFITISAVFCVLLTLLSAPLFGPPKYVEVIKVNGIWAIVSGVGLFLTYLGFNLLYSSFGASSYILYAVLSILTTVIIVSGLIFKETFNIYHWLALLSAIITVTLFSLGNSR